MRASLFCVLLLQAWAVAQPRPSVTDTQVRPLPALAEPAPRKAFLDPVFGCRVVRVTDRRKDVATGDTSRGLKNEYSRVQAFNADGSRFLLRGISASWYLYDSASLRPLKKLPLEGSVDPRWDAVAPGRLYFVDETRLMALDTESGKRTTVHDFARDLPGQKLAAVWGRYEGSPSRDGRLWAFMAEDSDWNAVALLVYHQKENRVTARRMLARQYCEVDSVTISPLGRYVVAQFDRSAAGDADHPAECMVYDLDLKTARCIRGVGHGDLALDAAGREVLVFQDTRQDCLAMADLASGQVTPLVPIDFSHSALSFHISGRALGRPGWAVVSTCNGGPRCEYTWMDNSIFLLELKPGGRIVRLAHNRTLVREGVEQDYWAEPHASPNRELTRILFTSNWGRSGSEEVDTYLIELPPDWDR